MSCYTNSIPMLAVATYAAATSSQGFDLGEYVNGALVIFVQTLEHGAWVYAHWQISPTATGPQSGRYATMRSLATSLRATGLSGMTLPGYMLGRWARVSLGLAGTGASSKVGAWIVARGQS